MDKQELIKRVKSFAWRLGSMIVVASLAFVADNIGLFGLPLEVQVILGLVLGEVTKAINNR